MIRFIVPGFLDGHDPIVAERWYYRFHGKEIVRAIGPWLRRYETYQTLPPPPPRYTPPPWGGEYPFVHLVSVFVREKPDVDFLKDDPIIP